jgi:hypothetical protein
MMGMQDFEKELHDRALREVAIWQAATARSEDETSADRR